MTDLFEHPEELPDNVQALINKFVDSEEIQDQYQACAELVTGLEKIGYTCDYYLDAVPFDLRKL